ncbi:30S ribosomal protein S3 [Thermocladium modestius]|uniref:Small ribosomal subunit protein uS3 n=1 Tax=Thermocladium modestius TaxID=62609 RepID=A0A830GYJ7_9CREN|nr:30S ribosomal protein S3 [Thermocladium modestius]GGP20918.1 30S ribosomal protein S3 [Thermocladium modestius]
MSTKVPVRKKILEDNKRKWMIKEYLEYRLAKSGYVDATIQRLPIGSRIMISAEHKNRIIGRKGAIVKELSEQLKNKFDLDNVMIDVVQVEDPQHNAKLVGLKIANAMAKGVKFRRAALAALRQLGDAKGVEIVISGKLSSERSRFEKYVRGVVYKSGNDASTKVQRSVTWVLLNQGLFGVKVMIMPPGVTPSDKIEIAEPEKVETKPEITVQGEAGGEANEQ